MLALLRLYDRRLEVDGQSICFQIPAIADKVHLSDSIKYFLDFPSNIGWCNAGHITTAGYEIGLPVHDCDSHSSTSVALMQNRRSSKRHQKKPYSLAHRGRRTPREGGDDQLFLFKHPKGGEAKGDASVCKV